MSKIVLVCFRDPASGRPANVTHHLRRFLASLCPDNLTPAQPVVATDGRGLYLGVFNPADPAATRACNAYSGWLADAGLPWWTLGAPAPTGSYALLRSGPDAVEALADYAASRTIWIARTDELFVASTSQRAIPYFLGSFEANPKSMAWMLSAGTLGPSCGWDRRAHPLAPDGRAYLDRARWKLTVSEPPINFDADPSSDDIHATRLREALEEIVGDLRLDPVRWVLPLSGGFDSRAILLLMRNRDRLRTVTWGRRDALELPGNDAYVARDVARAIGVGHQYYPTDLSDEPIEQLLDRFLVAGDGRTAGFLAYLDGFATWRSFFEAGVRGVIRGDHGFGPGPAPPFIEQADVLHFNSMTRWRDYAGAIPLAQFGLPELDEQPWPESFDKLATESLEDWRDRLYQLYRIPSYHAGQNDLKAAYVEIASPLLTREIMGLTRTHPERLRNGKRLFREVVAPRDVSVRYAVESALVPPGALTASPAVRELLCDELGSQRLRGVFSAKFADYLLSAVGRGQAAPLGNHLLRSTRRRLRLWLPGSVRAWVNSKPKRRALDLGWVALRAYIASRMMERMEIDARNGQTIDAVERPAAAVAMMAVPAQMPSQFL